MAPQVLNLKPCWHLYGGYALAKSMIQKRRVHVCAEKQARQVCVCVCVCVHTHTHARTHTRTHGSQSVISHQLDYVNITVLLVRACVKSCTQWI
mmetsp:Transcript_111673/g.193820  ORF Transcript_111673/g.193820 Transcript_111673/m.193820 type:complete len:94 (-) Transcript_111673:723-1004(-)